MYRFWNRIVVGVTLVGLISSSNWWNAVEFVHADEPVVAKPKPVRLVLPASIPAVVGIECNVYFDNVVLVPRRGSVLFDVICPKGRQQEDRWTWTPTAADVGRHSLELVVRDEDHRRIDSAKCVVEVLSNQRGTGKSLSVLMIGDSLTHASVYPQRVLDQSVKAGGPDLKLIGSHVPQAASPHLRHEGYGGWTAKRFATLYREVARMGEAAKRSSPFLYAQENGAPQLDFGRYCQDVNEGQFPDVATIFLGPNDIFPLDDDSLEAGIEDMLTHLDLVTKSIASASPSTRIAVLLPVPPASSQDAFGANYGSSQTRWQYRRNQHRLVERMLDRYGKPTGGDTPSPQIHLIPTHVGLDCAHNYPADSVPANAATDVKILRQSNAVHPAPSGYSQIGDILFAWLKGQTSE